MGTSFEIMQLWDSFPSPSRFSTNINEQILQVPIYFCTVSLAW